MKLNKQSAARSDL